MEKQAYPALHWQKNTQHGSLYTPVIFTLELIDQKSFLEGILNLYHKFFLAPRTRKKYIDGVQAIDLPLSCFYLTQMLGWGRASCDPYLKVKRCLHIASISRWQLYFILFCEVQAAHVQPIPLKSRK